MVRRSEEMQLAAYVLARCGRASPSGQSEQFDLASVKLGAGHGNPVAMHLGRPAWKAGWHARMSSRLAGNGACALCIARVSNIRLRPSPREDIGATRKPRLANRANTFSEEIAAAAADAAFGSPLVTNVHHGLIAEAIVAKALGPTWRWCSSDYSAWDFERTDGVRLEVKQAAAGRLGTLHRTHLAASCSTLPLG